MTDTLTPPSFTLSDGTAIPAIGYGTWQLHAEKEAPEAVRAALATGYRLIDTAANYHNEAGVGAGVRASDVPREEVLVSTKVWPEDLGYDKTMRSLEASLARLDLDYIDIILIHWPCSDEANLGSWKAFERLHEQGLVRHLGVSNFTGQHLDALRAQANVPPVLNQVEFHPLFFDTAVYDYCREHEIIIEAWSPLMQGKAFTDATLAPIAAKHGKSGAQVALRWCYQMGVVPLPKTKTPARMRSNLDIFGFALDDDDMATIAGMRTNQRFGPDPESYQFCPDKP